jgi:hypothetical protein
MPGIARTTARLYRRPPSIDIGPQQLSGGNEPGRECRLPRATAGGINAGPQEGGQLGMPGRLACRHLEAERKLSSKR